MAIIIDGNGKGTVTGTASDDEIYGGNGKDILDGGMGDDELHGGNGDDTLIGGAGDDTLYGDNGKDTAVYSGPMSNYLFELQNDGAIRVFDTTGADGSDLVYDVSYFKFSDTTVKLADLPLSQIQTTADYSWTTMGVTVDLVTNTATGPEIGAETLPSSIVNVIGGSGNDVLRGDAGNNTLNGNDGNDFLVGRNGDDTLNGGNGIDIAAFSGARTDYTFGLQSPGVQFVSGPAGFDLTTSVELLQFNGTDTIADTYMLGYGMTAINLNGFGLAAGIALFGRGVSDNLTMGGNANNRLIDLGADNDTLTLAPAGAGYGNLNLANVETLIGSSGAEFFNLTSVVTNNMLVDMSCGAPDQLNLANGNNVVRITNVEGVHSFGGSNTVTFLHNDPSVNQNFSGFDADDTLILAGSDSNYSFQMFGGVTVIGASNSGNETVNLTNNQNMSTFDLGSGIDSLTVNTGTFGSVFTVQNVEDVEAIGTGFDAIVIAGNSGGVTAVTAGLGSDQITASADVDHFHFNVTGDSSYNVPFRDIVNGFDASEDRFDFRDVPEFNSATFTWEVINVAPGNDILRIDFEGDNFDPGTPGNPNDDMGWEMAIQLNGLIGTLDNNNFLLV